MDVNKPEQGGGLGGVMRAVGAITVVLLAGIAILAVLDVIPREALQEWATKGVLLAVIVAAAAVLLFVLARGGNRP